MSTHIYIVNFFSFNSALGVYIQLSRINHWGTGQMLGASRFWGPGACLSKHSFADFSCFKLFSMRQNCRAFWLLPLVYRLRKLRTLPFIVFEWLEKNWTTQHHTLWPNNKIEISASMGVRRNLSREGNIVKFLLSLYRLLTMQWKW